MIIVRGKFSRPGGLHKASGLDLRQPQGAQVGDLAIKALISMCLCTLGDFSPDTNNKK